MDKQQQHTSLGGIMQTPLQLNCVYLQYVMQAKKIDRKTLAAKIGVSEVTVRNWTSGKGISPRNLIKLADGLGVDKHVLLQTDDQMAQAFLRKKLHASMAQDIAPVDDQTFLQIMRTLGMNIVAAQKVEVDVSDKGRDMTDAEKQLLGLVNGTSTSKDQANTE